MAKTIAIEEWQASSDGTLEHRGGIPFYQAPIPFPLHFCKPQTQATRTDGKFVEWCACHAFRTDGGPWRERNTARKNRAADIWAKA